LQRTIAQGRDIVTEGRDQGSEVFPDAECKIFLTASPLERARRRQQQMAAAGRPMRIEDILKAQDRRDAEDRLRPMGSLRPAQDAVVIESDGMTSEQVLARALQIVREASQSRRVKAPSQRE
jgi:cytidylate kinase